LTDGYTEDGSTHLVDGSRTRIETLELESPRFINFVVDYKFLRIFFRFSR
jgi:hypothetical protein